MTTTSTQTDSTDSTSTYWTAGPDGEWIEHVKTHPAPYKPSKPLITKVTPSTTKTWTNNNYSNTGFTYQTCNVDHNGDELIWTYTEQNKSVEFVIGDVPGWKKGILHADVVLDLNNNVSFAPKKVVLSAPARFMVLNQFMPQPPKAEVIKLDWPDWNAVSAPLAFWQELLRLLPDKSRVMITCHGGHGRSGTCLAAIMIAAGFKAKEAIKYVRSKHCKKAIESNSQEEYLLDLGEESGEVFTDDDVIEVDSQKPTKEVFDRCMICDKQFPTPSEWEVCLECEISETKEYNKQDGLIFKYCMYCGEDYEHPSSSEVCESCADRLKDILPFD